jgi:hypothetical protein
MISHFSNCKRPLSYNKGLITLNSYLNLKLWFLPFCITRVNIINEIHYRALPPYYLDATNLCFLLLSNFYYFIVYCYFISCCTIVVSIVVPLCMHASWFKSYKSENLANNQLRMSINTKNHEKDNQLVNLNDGFSHDTVEDFRGDEEMMER